MLPSVFDNLFLKPARAEKGGLLTSVPDGKFGLEILNLFLFGSSPFTKFLMGTEGFENY